MSRVLVRLMVPVQVKVMVSPALSLLAWAMAVSRSLSPQVLTVIAVAAWAGAAKPTTVTASMTGSAAARLARASVRVIGGRVMVPPVLAGGAPRLRQRVAASLSSQSTAVAGSTVGRGAGVWY
jgi:hypothetical protein